MTVTIIDGFDVYPDVQTTSYGLQGGWTVKNPAASTIFLVGGRFGAQGVQIHPENDVGWIGQPTTGTDFALGVATRLDDSLPPASCVLFFRETDANGALICGVGINGSQQYFLWVGTVTNIVALDPTPITVGAWHYLEFIAHINAGAGTLALYRDGIEVATFAGAIANGPAAYVALGTPVATSPTWEQSYDDFYLTNSTARIGEMRVETLYPSADVQKQWTPLVAGANYLQVQETHVDGDASYVFSNTVGNEDLYAHTALTGVPVSIPAIQVRVCADKDDSATRQLASSLKSGGTLVNGPTFTVPFSSYIYERDIYMLDPNGNIAWTGASVNAASIGQKVIA